MCAKRDIHACMCVYMSTYICLKEREREGLQMHYFCSLVPIIKHLLWYSCECVLFPIRVASVVFCTKSHFRLLNQNLEFRALLLDIYGEMTHNVHRCAVSGWSWVESTALSTLRRLNTSPCWRTTRCPVSPLSCMWRWNVTKFILMPFYWDSVISRGESNFCMTLQFCLCLCLWGYCLAQGHISNGSLNLMKDCFVVCYSNRQIWKI